MNDLESIILSLFDEGYTKSQIASQLDEILAKASSETEKARHDALVTEDAANVYAAIAKYYADKYNGSMPHYSIEDIIELLDALYSDGDDTCILCTETETTDLDDVYDALKGYFLTEHNDPTFMDDHCTLERLKQYLTSIYAAWTNENFSSVDSVLENIQADFYDYWYYTHNNTEIEITPEEIAYILEGYYNRDHNETTPQLLTNIAELLDVYFMRTRKSYHGREIYKWFPHPDDFADYLDSINFPKNNVFHEFVNIIDDILELLDEYLIKTQPNYNKGDIYHEFSDPETFEKFINDIYLRYLEPCSYDPNKALMQAIDTFLAKSIDDYKPETLTEMFPEPKNIGDYVLTLYRTYKYFETLGLDGKNNFGDILNLIFNA